jgi:hypothetical protein
LHADFSALTLLRLFPHKLPLDPTVAQMMVAMERSYITAGFFRYTMSRRYAASQQQALLQQALAKGEAQQAGKKKGIAGLLGGGGAQVRGGSAARKQLWAL